MPSRCATGTSPGPMVPTSSFVNELRYGIATDRQWDGFDQAELGQGLGYLQVSVNGTTLGPASYLPRIEPMETRHQFQDNATWTKGTHTIKVRRGYRHHRRVRLLHQQRLRQLHLSDGQRRSRWITAATPPAPRTGSATCRPSATARCSIRMTDLGFYLQDQWRATDRLTVSMGARYEKAHPAAALGLQSRLPADLPGAFQLEELCAAPGPHLPAER